MIDLIIHIYDKITENPEILDHSDSEIDLLVTEGYDKGDVLKAFDYAVTSYNKNKDPKNIRFLSPDEMRLLSEQAYGFLMNLQIMGLLEPQMVELLITRAMVLQSFPVGLIEIKKLVDFLMMNPENWGQRMIFDILTYQDPEDDYN